jgi:hypothetical protein
VLLPAFEIPITPIIFRLARYGHRSAQNFAKISVRAAAFSRQQTARK